jgi:undecaprenyl-diphosphatase
VVVARALPSYRTRHRAGVTEFLLVSSSGHLLLGQHFLGVDQERFGLSCDASNHTGTVLAVVWFFRRDLLGMGRALARSWSWFDLEEPDQRMAYLVLAASVPAGVIGFLLEDFFATAVRSPWIVVVNLVLVGDFSSSRRPSGQRASGPTS